jgi:hypothetical protein
MSSVQVGPFARKSIAYERTGIKSMLPLLQMHHSTSTTYRYFVLHVTKSGTRADAVTE